MKRIIKICMVLAAVAVLGLGTASCKHGHGGGGGGGPVYTPGNGGGGGSDGGGEVGSMSGSPTNSAPGSSSFNLRVTPTAEENAVLAEMNFARKEPLRYIAERVDPQRGVRSVRSTGITDAEFDAALDELVAEMTAMTPKTYDFEFSVGLFKAAQEWVLIQGAGTEWGHQPNGGMSERIHRLSGCNSFICGECIAYGPTTAADMVVGLLIDDCMNESGSHYRGHRYCILEMNGRGPWSHAGVAIGSHGLSGTMCNIDFGGGGYHD